jgi:hypothetical protein
MCLELNGQLTIGVACGGRVNAVTNKQAGLQVCTKNSMGGPWRQGVCSYKQASRPSRMKIAFYGVACGGRVYVVTKKQASLQVCLYNSMGWPVEVNCM